MKPPTRVAFVHMGYWVYILQSEATGRYYIGSTADLDDRLRRHNENRSAATKVRGPWRLVHREEFPSRRAAVARERQIKAQKSRAYVERVVRAAPVG
jgi:putative endonuclease